MIPPLFASVNAAACLFGHAAVRRLTFQDLNRATIRPGLAVGAAAVLGQPGTRLTSWADANRNTQARKRKRPGALINRGPEAFLESGDESEGQTQDQLPLPRVSSRQRIIHRAEPSVRRGTGAHHLRLPSVPRCGIGRLGPVEDVSKFQASL